MIEFQRLQELLDCKNQLELQAGISLALKHLGFDYFYFFLQISIPSPNSPATVQINRYPDSWWKHYSAQNYAAIDPVVVHCLHSRNLTPILWNRKTYGTADVERILDEAKEHGLACGVTFPLNSHYERGYFSIAAGNALKLEQILAAMAPAHLLASHIHEAIRKLVTPECEDIRKTVKLSQREIDCLKWSSFGKTSLEISRIMNISEHTVAFHMNNVVKKLGAGNRREAVVIALANGLILS